MLFIPRIGFGLIVNPLLQPAISRSVGIITQRGVSLTPAAEEVIALLRGVIGVQP